jgi:pimeloyl-ACP methyl ester carboxylesterase
MRITLAIAVIVVSLLSACSVNKLRHELKRADNTYAYIRVDPIEGTTGGSKILLVIFQQTETGLKMINYRTPAAGEDVFFLVPVADYTVVAFEDLNQDYIYQQGEPAASSDNPPLFNEMTTRDVEPDYDSWPSQALYLSASHKLSMTIDLSTQALSQKLDKSRKSYLKIVSWDDPAFSRENVAKGLWQPLSFLEETGFGLYLLEELDPDKQPLLLVHGINGSPLNFKTLADNLDDRYQLLLYQYPSDFSLNHTTYILHRAVDDFLERYPYPQLQVLAHSMGGLVDRGMISLNDAKTNARINTYITLATPWSGHDAARLGIEWSPAVAPVWKSMVPNSKYLQQIFSKPLAENIDHHLFFSFSGRRDGASQGNDGVVTVQSQLKTRAQREATAVYGINDNHNGILEKSQHARSSLSLLARV